MASIGNYAMPTPGPVTRGSPEKVVRTRQISNCCAISAKAEQHLSYLGSTVKRLEVNCSMIAKPRCCETAKGLRLYKNSNQENRNQLGQASKIKDYPTHHSNQHMHQHATDQA